MTMNLWHELDPGPSVPDVIHVIVEIPKGSRNKYEYHKQTGAFKLDRVLYSPVHYPGDYSFIPQTYYDDDDPFDVLVVTNLPTFTGCIVEARPIGWENAMMAKERIRYAINHYWDMRAGRLPKRI